MVDEHFDCVHNGFWIILLHTLILSARKTAHFGYCPTQCLVNKLIDFFLQSVDQVQDLLKLNKDEYTVKWLALLASRG